jgi:hypothetical protein
LNFDRPDRATRPTRATPQEIRLALRTVTTVTIVVALVAISVALAKQADGDLVVVAGLNVRQLSVIVCGIVGFGLGTLVLSVTNQVAIAREQTAGIVMAVVVFVVVMGMCALAVVLLLAGSLASTTSYFRLGDSSGDDRLMVAVQTWNGNQLSLYSGDGVEFESVPVEMPPTSADFNPFASGDYTLSKRNGALELRYPVTPGGQHTVVTIPR